MRRLAFGLLLAASLSAPADAALVRYDFAGTLSTGDTASAFASDAGLGGGSGSYNGYVVFDSGANLGSATSELYASSDFLLQIGGDIFSSANPSVDTATASIDSSLANFGLFFGSAQNLTSGANDAMNLSIFFSSGGSGLFQNPDLSTASLSLTFANDDPDNLFANGDVTQFATTPIPEPATWTMLIGGFGLIGAALRIRRRRELAVRLA